MIYIFFFCQQALPNRKHALIVSPWPETQLPRNIGSVKKFENLQALVSLYLYFLLLTFPIFLWNMIHLHNHTIGQFMSFYCYFLFFVFQVRAIRNARAEYFVEPAKRISASVVANKEVIDYIAVSVVTPHFSTYNI